MLTHKLDDEFVKLKSEVQVRCRKSLGRGLAVLEAQVGQLATNSSSYFWVSISMTPLLVTIVRPVAGGEGGRWSDGRGS